MPVPSDWPGSAAPVADYAWRAAAAPDAALGQAVLASICEALEDAYQARCEASTDSVDPKQMDQLLRALVDEDAAFWGPILGRIALMAYEGVLYGEGVDRESAWRALEHPWSRDRGESAP